MVRSWSGWGIGLLALQLWLQAALGAAQPATALRATAPLSEMDPADYLVLEPALPQLHELAASVATVLELRNGTVLIGVVPVTAADRMAPGHIRITMDEDCVLLAMAVAQGEVRELPLPLDRDGTAPDPRAVALAIETLRDPWLVADEDELELDPSQDTLLPGVDAAREPAVQPLPPDVEAELEEAMAVGNRAAEAGLPSEATEPFGDSAGLPDADGTEPVPRDERYRATQGAVQLHARDRHDTAGDPYFADERLDPHQPATRSVGVLRPVRPFFYARAYSGASSFSRGPQLGVATGAGLCAVGHCLVLSTEVPVTNSQVMDLRYRYVTFLASFYSRPWRWGRFTPGASLGFLSRLGYLSQDMGLANGDGLETDLGARASVELAFSLYDYVDLMVESGVDVPLDQVRVGIGGTTDPRVQRLSPWLQLAIRVRPEME